MTDGIQFAKATSAAVKWVTECALWIGEGLVDLGEALWEWGKSAARDPAGAWEEIKDAVVEALNFMKQWALSNAANLFDNLFTKILNLDKSSLPDTFDMNQCADLFGIAASLLGSIIFVGFTMLLCLITVHEMSNVFTDKVVTIIWPTMEEPEGALDSPGEVFAKAIYLFGLFTTAGIIINSCFKTAAPSNTLLAPILIFLLIVDIVLFIVSIILLINSL